MSLKVIHRFGNSLLRTYVLKWFVFICLYLWVIRVYFPIFYCWKIKKKLKSICNNSSFKRSTSWSKNAPVQQSNTSHAWTFHGCNLEQLLVFKALRVDQRVHQSTSHAPQTRGQSMYAVQNNSLFLGLYESVDECTSQLVEHLPSVDDPCMQSITTLCFRALWVDWQVHQATSRTPATCGQSTTPGRGGCGGREPILNTTSCWDFITNFLHIGQLAKKDTLKGTYTYIYIYI